MAERLWGQVGMFEHSATVWMLIAIGGALAISPVVFIVLSRAGLTSAARKTELWQRYTTWLYLAPAMIVPILLGPIWMVVGVGILSMLCYREYARGTGLFRETLVSLSVVIGVWLLMFASIDHWYGLFMALTPLVITLIASVSLIGDRPQGYVQRVGLGVLGFVLFGTCLGHLAYFANDADYRPVVLMLIIAVETNDVFAFMVGASLGRRKLVPNTSPGKTVGGAIGALVLTTPLVMAMGSMIFAGTRLDDLFLLALLGLIISAGGQFGDLMLSAVKRDIGVKDMGVSLPGHGGFLDRFDSILLVSPAVFHFVRYFNGIGAEHASRIVTGGAG